MKRELRSGWVFAWLVTLSALALTGCQNPAAGGTGLRVATSTIAAPAVQGWVAELSKPPNPTGISLRATGSTTALSELIQGNVDVVVASRRMSANELLAARAAGRKVEEFLLGFAIYQVLVHPQNPVASLTLEQVGDIFSRDVKDWSEVGGPKLPIQCVYRRTFPGHFDLFFEKEVSLKYGAFWARPDSGVTVADDTAAIAAAIGANPGSIGYLLATDPAPAAKALAIKSPLSKSPEAPSVEAALAGRYPMLRPLYMYLDAGSARGVRYFQEFALGDRGRKVTSDAGFAPVPPPPGGKPELDPLDRIPAW
ncbi:MAG: substrate-binding domain-containing protein [Candidatus Wallbacteria bacterium]|nr:substrate-binding domain-containing protein [Candidatus Wallbacteria bacterium]